MKVRTRKSFLQLPQHEKDIINQTLTEEIEKQVNKNMAKLQKLWLQFACIVLNRNFGFGKKRAMLFLGNWKQMYHQNNRFKDEAEQTAFLETEIGRIFGKDGYPTKYVDKLEEMK